MTVENLLKLHDYLTGKAKAIMEAKNHDYTSGSGDPFANFRGSTFFGIHPVVGMQLRQQDKMQRIKTFVEKGELRVKGESVLDAILDQINYLVLQYGYIMEQSESQEYTYTNERDPQQLDLFPAISFLGCTIVGNGDTLEQRRISGLQADLRETAR